MKLHRIIFLLLLSSLVYSQETSFVYSRAMSFPVVDSLVSPFLCTVDSTGNVWVVSTNTVEASALHSLFMAAPGDTAMSLVYEFADQDSVRDITGITSIGNDIFISTRMIAPSSEPVPYYYPYSQMFYMPDGDKSKMIAFKKPGYWDYGTWYTSIASTKDGYIYFGQSYLVTLGAIDGRNGEASFGNTIDFARIDWGTSMEPGGGLTYPNIMNLIRDVAVNPDGNYNDTATVIYTSRNASSDPGGEATGGIAAWTGGKQSDPLSYHSIRINDLSGFLTFKNNSPYGIAINPSTKNLFVCGTDDTKKWVKGFLITGNFAIQSEELPSSTSLDVQDPNGAPFIAPADVAFNKDGNIAYVADEAAKKVFKFKFTTTEVSETQNLIKRFEVNQNYPNPFNPSTNISVDVSVPSILKAEVFNILGEKVSALVNKGVSSGTHILSFDGTGLNSGIYFCKVTAGEYSKTIKMMLSK